MMQMKYIFTLLLLLPLLHGQSSNTTPKPINKEVTISATKPDFKATEYFSLADANPQLLGKEWYAFITLRSPETKFWIRIHVYLSTVNKNTGVRSETKSQCESDHNQLHDCFLSHKRINPQEENLVVQLVFQQEILFDLKVQINHVRMLALGQSVGLRQREANFTRILRLDVGAIKESFDYLQLQFREVLMRDEFTNALTFFVSFEEMPPDNYRHSGVSLDIWSDQGVAVLSYQQLQEVQVITILCGITDHNNYRFSSKLLVSPAPLQEIKPDETLNEIMQGSKSYRVDLPARSANLYYLLRIHFSSYFDFNLTDVRINGGKELNQMQMLLMLLREGSTKSNNQLDVWLNDTITSFQFTINVYSLSAYKIDLNQFDVDTIVLRQRVKWNDKLAINQTQFAYIVIDTKSSEDKINFQVEAAFRSSGFNITFHNCVEREVSQCQSIAKSDNKTRRTIGMPQISPAKHSKGSIGYYRFNNISITKHQIQPYLYRSTIIVQVTAVTALIDYQIRWHMFNPITQIKENQLVQGRLEADDYRIFSFTVLDASNLAFARVHTIRGSSNTFSFGSATLVDPQTYDPTQEIPGFVPGFDGSISFTELKDKSTYYVYILTSAVRDYFQLTLTYGYDLDQMVTHPISFLTLGEHSSNHLLLQPLEVLFIEIRQTNVDILTVSNAIPLKICEFPQNNPPKTHKDMTNSHYCDTYSTVNHFITYNFNKTGKFYVGIENENSRAVSVDLETDNTYLRCVPSNMGQTKFMVFNKNKTRRGHRAPDQQNLLCLMYEIPEKGDIEVLVDIKNPRLQGVALPQVSIGKWQTVMSTNLLFISGEDIEASCQHNYEECMLQIEVQVDQQHRIEQDFIAVTAAYTTQPLPLKDGLAHHSSIRPAEIKNFKYPIYTHENITITLQNSDYRALRVYGQLVTSQQKFHYPTREQYTKNETDIYESAASRYFYPSTLTIPSADLIEKCEYPFKLCYLLLSVYPDPDNTKTANFLIQATQTVSTLTAGSRLQKYIEKDSKAYFNYKNTQPNSTLLFFTSSNTKDCLKLDVYTGNKGPNSQLAIQSGIEEVIITNAKAEWYTISALAKESCYFTMQTSVSQKSVRELVSGFANYFTLDANQKRYYLIHNTQSDHVKVMASISRKASGQLNIQAMPVPEDSLQEFVRFINGQELGKRSKLAFVWSDINHITIRSSDAKFCKNCFICLQAHSTKALEGYLTIPTSNQHSLFLTNYVSYDVLLANQSFSWLVGPEINQNQVSVAVQAGQLEIVVQDSKKKELWRKGVKFNKADPTKNVLQLQQFKIVDMFDHLNINITALDNADYSIYSTKKGQSGKEDEQENNLIGFVQVGRPYYLYIYNGQQQCLQGQLDAIRNEFIITTHSEKSLQIMKNSLKIKLTVGGKQQNIKKDMTPNTLMLTLDSPVKPASSDFQICFSLSNHTQQFGGSFLYVGSLNYFPQNTVLHVRRAMNLTFMSEGRGVIEVDQCAARSVITLNSQFKDVKSINSGISSRRVANNLIHFTFSGPVFMHVDSPDFVALSWKNYHRSSLNGHGYDVYSASTFLVAFEANSQTFSAKVKPIVANSGTQGNQRASQKDLPSLLSISYHVFMAGEEMELYGAMNCDKGIYMSWVRKLEGQAITKEAAIKLSNVGDMKKLFRNKEYVLVGVKADVVMQWPKNNFTEKYRFYYPYQEIMLSQFHSDVTREDDQAPTEPSSQSSLTGLIAVGLTAIVVGVITFMAVRWLKRKYWRSDPFSTELDQQRSESIDNGTELPNKSQHGVYAPPSDVK